MGKVKRKTSSGLANRRETYLIGVPDSERKGRTKPGSQNRKKSFGHMTKKQEDEANDN